MTEHFLCCVKQCFTAKKQYNVNNLVSVSYLFRPQSLTDNFADGSKITKDAYTTSAHGSNKIS